jgi:phosphatidylserine/phosphatidylglycerophosphate/cardiolipin synthase-like enzyme
MRLSQRLLIAGALAACGSSAAAQKFSVFFAVPLVDGTKDPALENKIIEMIGLAAPKSELHMSMYQFSHESVAKALIEASKRGVQVHVIIDKEANEKDGVLDAAITKLVKDLPANAVTFCTRGNGSCQGKGIDHNKFYIFSELTDGSKHVVIQSSANLTADNLQNNMLIDRDDKGLYDGYLGYWKLLEKQVENLDYAGHAEGEHTHAYWFPRQKDEVLAILDEVNCTDKSKVRVTMAFWDDGRMDVAKKLVALAKAGCDVQVDMRTAGKNSSQNIIDAMRNEHLSVGLYPAEHGTNIHSKYLLIDSDFKTDGKVEHHRYVYTGSHNYTNGALKSNDETMLRIDNAEVFDAYMANWGVIRAQIEAAGGVEK